MAQALTAADRMPGPGDVLTRYGYERLNVTAQGIRCFVHREPAVSGTEHSKTALVAGEFARYRYISRADGGPVTKDISPPEQEYVLFIPRDPYDAD